MPLFILRLEDRILFDASAPAVIAQVVSDQGSDSQAAAPAETHQGDSSDLTSQPSDSSDGSSSQDHGPALVDSFSDTHDNDVNVLLISSNIDDAQQLANATLDDVITIVYDYENTTLADLEALIRDSLAGKKADTISFATEGQSGFFYLLNDINVTAETLTENGDLATFWQNVGNMLNKNGRVDLLGCFVGGVNGQDFGLIDSLSHLLNTESKDISVAASENMTGNTEGSDWILETGGIDASFYFNGEALAQWNFALDDFTVTTILDSGAGSFRAAVEAANANGVGSDNITVGVSGFVTLSSSITLTSAANIDGLGTPGIPNGAGFELYANGVSNALLINTTGIVTIDRIAFTSASTAGILVQDGQVTINESWIGIGVGGFSGGNNVGIQIDGGLVTVSNSYIASSTIAGVDSISPVTLTDNIITLNGTGITVTSGAQITGNTISNNSSMGIVTSGFNTIIDFNVISNNGSLGILALGDNAAISGNIIYNNGGGIQIGFDTSDYADNAVIADNTILNNGGYGIQVTGGSWNTTIGDTDDNAKSNIIGGHLFAGIHFTNDSGNGAIIQNNYIGVSDISGTPSPNGSGILVGNLSGNLVDLTIGSTNPLLGNIIVNNTLGINVDNVVGNGEVRILNNVIGNSTTAIFLQGTGKHTITGNYIGTDTTGTAANGNTEGIFVNSTGETFIGSNVISANVTGISLNAGTATVEDNYIGTDKDGGFAINSSQDTQIVGILVQGGVHTIGGATEAERNIIVVNSVSFDSFAILVYDGTPTIQNNYIGTDVTGNIDLTTGSAGIVSSSSTAFTVSDNLISGFNVSGIYAAGTGLMTITSNKIGTNFNETQALGNAIGIYLTSTGNAAISSNSIKFNGTGIETESSQVTIKSNTIVGGTRGIIVDTSGTITIGGSQSEGNTILFSGAQGILLENGSHNIYGNTISNANIGIYAAGGGIHQIGDGTEDHRNYILNSNTGIRADVSVNIQGNNIGIDSFGSVHGNTVGVDLYDSGNASVIGGVVDEGDLISDEANLISGNTTGIKINDGTIEVRGNLIGTFGSS